METKAEIRKRILGIRTGLSDEEVTSKSESIVQKVIKTPEYREADNILLYADYCREVMTRGIFEDALLHRKKIYFPRVDKLTNTMDFFQVISIRQLDRGYKDILEPREDVRTRYKFLPREDTLAILPGVAFDTSGYRIGYGKGFMTGSLPAGVSSRPWHWRIPARSLMRYRGTSTISRWTRS